jgi:hypothetical protein
MSIGHKANSDSIGRSDPRNIGSQTSKIRYWTSDIRCQMNIIPTSGRTYRISEDLRPDIGSRKSNIGSQTSDIGSRTSDIGSRTSDIGSRTSDIWSWTSEIRYRMNIFPTSGRTFQIWEEKRSNIRSGCRTQPNLNSPIVVRQCPKILTWCVYTYWIFFFFANVRISVAIFFKGKFVKWNCTVCTVL